MKAIKSGLSVIAFALAALILVPTVLAYDIPSNDSRAKHFYIFGPQGDPLDGKESDEFVLYVDVPAGVTKDVVIKVNDPETGGSLDGVAGAWDTETEISVSGKSELAKQSFGSEKDYDGKSFKFGPFAVTDGEKVGDVSRFTVKLKTLSGDDLNVFSFNISPDQSEAFSDKFTFVLLPPNTKPSPVQYFYPEVPAGASKLIVRNYDMDKEGGVGEIYNPLTRTSEKVNDSTSGEWTETEIPVSVSEPTRFEYRVVTTYQQRGHAGIEFKDDKGNTLPIYFRKGKVKYTAPAPKPAPAPKKEAPKDLLSCNQFTFDARSSYDENNDKISYAWDFGDGNTSDEPVVTHYYEKGGKYTVKLTVTDNSGLECSTAVTNQEVSVNTPPQAALKNPDLTCVGTEVTFDASATADDQPANLKYHWAFSDGTSAEGETVTKSFDKGGVYNVVLTVDDGAGTSCSRDSIQGSIRVNTPPVANAGKDVELYLRDPKQPFNVNFNGTGSYDADNDSLDYTWDFGDGNTGEGAKTSHVYEKSGDYTAKLVVNDQTGAGCDTAVDTVNVTVGRGPLANAGKPQEVCQGESVSFDASESLVDGSVEYTWDFGDGETGTGATATHTYKAGGKYNVTVTVDDGKGSPVSKSTAGTYVIVNSRPVAELASVEKLCTGDSVTLDASGSSDADGDSLNYTWDFGDGNTVTGKSKVSYKYAKGGTYPVTVKVDDGKGGSCSLATASTTVKVNTPPTANAGPNLTCCQEQVSSFDGSASSDPDGDSLSYKWNFGDGGSADEAKVSHAYEKSGSYRVTLVVDDNSGTRCSQSASGFTANVNAKPVPVIQVRQK